MGTGLEDLYVIRENKKLRFGYTTGSCAAAACKAATKILLGKEKMETVELMTPKGILLSLQLEEIKQEESAVICGVRKDGGDDPDTTNGLLIFARVEKCQKPGIQLDGGVGVGRVTRPGLSQEIGEAAINPVPKAMILKVAEEVCQEYDYEGGLKVTIFVPDGEETAKKTFNPAAINPVPKAMILKVAEEVCQEYDYEGGLKVTIFVPDGEETAKKTFNPRLGILGGISILGTSGIVEPMSEAALIESIRVEMRQRHAQGEEYILATPGNYGADYLREHMTLPYEKNIKCSNYVGETIDMAVDMGVKGILFVAHIGKFVKLASGIMNTHSHSADARMETIASNAIDMAVDMGVKGILFVAHIGKFVKLASGIMNTHSHSADARMETIASNAIRAGAPLACAKKILEGTTTDEALDILSEYGFLEKTMEEILSRIQYYLNHRSYSRILLGAVVFNNIYGYLGQTEDAGELIKRINKEK